MTLPRSLLVLLLLAGVGGALYAQQTIAIDIPAAKASATLPNDPRIMALEGKLADQQKQIDALKKDLTDASRTITKICNIEVATTTEPVTIGSLIP